MSTRRVRPPSRAYAPHMNSPLPLVKVVGIFFTYILKICDVLLLQYI